MSEASDQGETRRYDFYEHTKDLAAAPPYELMVNEKNKGEYWILNVVRVVYTTNNRDALFVPPDDRRTFVCRSECTPESFAAGYFDSLYGWLDGEGTAHVVAYLRTYDWKAAGFDPKAPPPKTEAFWAMVAVERTQEIADLATVLEAMERPDAVTLTRITTRVAQMVSPGPGVIDLTQVTGLAASLLDRKNTRRVAHWLEEVGYVRVPNKEAKDGYFWVDGKRCPVFAREELGEDGRHRAAHAIQGGGRRMIDAAQETNRRSGRVGRGSVVGRWSARTTDLSKPCVRTHPFPRYVSSRSVRSVVLRNVSTQRRTTTAAATGPSEHPPNRKTTDLTDLDRPSARPIGQMDAYVRRSVTGRWSASNDRPNAQRLSNAPVGAGIDTEGGVIGDDDDAHPRSVPVVRAGDPTDPALRGAAPVLSTA